MSSIKRKLSVSFPFIYILCALSTYQVGAQSSDITSILKQFDNIIDYQNSGIYFGKPNTPYPNINEENHPFFAYLDYQNASVTYKGQPYLDLQIRYDIVRNDIQILPDKKLNLLGITLFKEFISDFSIGNFHFERLEGMEMEKKFFQIILKNPSFSLFKSYVKKEKERLKNRNVLYNEYVLDTTLFILSNGRLEEIKSKKQLIAFFPDDKNTLNILFQRNKSKKMSKDAIIIAVLKDWHSTILNPKSVE
ncbi:hypothetical protein [Flagellimonas eckloniae]|uniref:Uncharacterized protein n=1 Tax=Flagellimonas eckloniae TaxID=346185 RepID=A0A0N8WGD9_9FLAO|nr:hypothetical protein [Allomuricauda eckloniae]KQC31227.1 hypothetical protein AAY42_16035 [Allomuricauda eckloniae]